MRILITGVCGQDGYYLSRQLAEEGHDVYGLVHRQKVQELPYGRIVRGDLADTSSIFNAVEQVKPHEIYNMGAVCHVQYSYQHPELSLDINGTGLVRILEAVKRFTPSAKVYQASTSELFGPGTPPFDEDSPMNPVSPYAIAKHNAHQIARIYRKMGIWVSCGILFNHVSPLSGTEFIMNKLIKSAYGVQSGEIAAVPIGNLTAKRDFGCAPEYCDGIIRIMRHTEPLDLVLSTGVSVSIAELAAFIFDRFDLQFEEWAYLDEDLVRPVDIPELRGDSTKAVSLIGWKHYKLWDEIAVDLIEAFYGEYVNTLGGYRCRSFC